MKKSKYLFQVILALVLCYTPAIGTIEERITNAETQAASSIQTPAETAFPDLFSSDAGSNGFDVALNSCEGPPAKSEADKDCL